MPIDYPKPPYPSQQQPRPGIHGKNGAPSRSREDTYEGSGRGNLSRVGDRDSPPNAAVAAGDYGLEGADVLIAYLSESDDAKGVKD